MHCLLQFIGFIVLANVWCPECFAPAAVFRRENRHFRGMEHRAMPNSKNMPPPEFSRILKVGKIPLTNDAKCRLVATQAECSALSKRFELFHLENFTANVTVCRREKEKSVLVQGLLGALISVSAYSNKKHLVGNVVSKLLYDSAATDEEILKIFYKDNRYDDFINSSGDIDIGEICAQQLFLDCNSQLYHRRPPD